MKRDAKELLALGALAGGAILLLQRGRPGARSTPPPAAPTPAPQPAPAPQVPQPAPGQPMGPVALSGGRALLVQGGRYRARVQLSGLMALGATEAAVRARLESAGFGSVVVRGEGSGRYQAAGTWTRGTITAPLPEQITQLERIA